MVRQEDILQLARIEIFVIVLFVVMKMTRPYVLENTESLGLHILFLSFPNLAEGIIGVLTSTILLLAIRRSLKLEFLSDSGIYLVAVVFSAMYVLLQEFKIHNLGGNNVYDVNDVMFSVIGLSIGFGIIWILRPTIKEEVSHDSAS